MMLKSSVDVGRQYEQKAISILRENGFKNIEWISKKNWGSCFDLKATKRGKSFAIEVRFRSYRSKVPYFIFSKRKMQLLHSLKENVLLFLLDETYYEIINLKDVDKLIFPISIKNRKVYVINDLKLEHENTLYVRNFNGSLGLFLTRWFNQLNINAKDKVAVTLDDQDKLTIEKVQKK